MDTGPAYSQHKTTRTATALSPMTLGSTVIGENVVTAKGAVFMVPLHEIERLVRDAGFHPARQNTRYEILAVA